MAVTVLSACSGGCASLRSLFDRGEDAAAERVNPLAGTYEVSSLAGSARGCEALEPRETDTVRLRVKRVDAAEGSRAADSDGGVAAFRVELCKSRSCEVPTRDFVVVEGDDGVWDRRRGRARFTDGAAVARNCRLRLVRWTLSRTEEGVALRRTEREGEVALEGNERCDGSTALEFGPELPCRAQREYRGR